MIIVYKKVAVEAMTVVEAARLSPAVLLEVIVALLR